MYGFPKAGTKVNVNDVDSGKVRLVKDIDIVTTQVGAPYTPDSVVISDNTVTVDFPACAVGGGGDEWTRPVDWLAIPAIAGGEEVFYGLFAVQNVTLGNFVAFSFAGAYTVDWGDGTAPENVATGVTAQHQFNWADVGNVTSEGWRQALIKVTPQGGSNLTNINLQKAHTTIGSGKVSQFMDMVISLPNLSGNNQTLGNGVVVYHRNCRRVWVVSIGAITNVGSMFASFNNLKDVPLFSTSACTSGQLMFQGCYSLEVLPLFDTSSFTAFNSMLIDCASLKELPLFDTSSAISFNAFCQRCTSLEIVPLLNTALVQDFSNMFNGCSSLETLPAFNMASATIMTTTFYQCISFITLPALNTSLVTGMSNLFSASGIREVSLNMTSVTNTAAMFVAGSMQKLTATGLTRGVSVANNMMSATELNNFFTSLGTASGSQTITVTGNHGAGTCNTAIATAKGFTVVT